MNTMEAVERALAELDRSSKTVATYGNGLRLFVEFAEETFTYDDFIRFPATISKMYAHASLVTYFAALRYFADWCIINDIVSPTPSQSARFARALKMALGKHTSRLPKVVSTADVTSMEEYSDDSWSPIRERNHAIIVFLAVTGCRNEEITRLKVADLDIENRSAVITGKGDKDRVIYFNDQTVTALQTYWQVRGWNSESDPVFARHDKRVSSKREAISTTAVRSLVKKAALRTGCDGSITPHSLRHCFATRVLRETGNISAVQQLLGHANPATTQIYARLEKSDLQNIHEEVFNQR